MPRDPLGGGYAHTAQGFATGQISGRAQRNQSIIDEAAPQKQELGFFDQVGKFFGDLIDGNKEDEKQPDAAGAAAQPDSDDPDFFNKGDFEANADEDVTITQISPIQHFRVNQNKKTTQ